MTRKWNWQIAVVLTGLMVIAPVLLTTGIGCKKQTGLEASRRKGGSGKSMAQQYLDGMKKAQQEQKRPVRPPEPPPAPKMPEVKMPEQFAKTCLVKVGDPMPEAELGDLDGKRVPFRSLWGKRLTVILFWNSENLYSTQALEYAQIEVAEPFRNEEVRVIGIAVRDPPGNARKAVEAAGAQYVNLLDPEGQYFSKVATDTEKVPRVYLLDPSGKVLWFDIEYTASTRRDLDRAIKFVLGEKRAQP